MNYIIEFIKEIIVVVFCGPQEHDCKADIEDGCQDCNKEGD